MNTIKSVYKIGNGPSSSHTVGPYHAAQIFGGRYPQADAFRVTLFGSLAFTGEGHGTGKAIVSGLPGAEVVFDREHTDLPHPNTMLFEAFKGGVRIGAFVRGLPPMVWENFKINSAIDAVPFNIRYCVRKFGYSRQRLSENLPILAQTNQDGNCYLITLISMIFVFLLGVEVSWMHIVAIAVLVLFLSVGAPNQPGSMLIGILIITFFLKADQLISIAIYAEVFFGSLQNIINVIGDIVTVAIEERKHELRRAA